jgi:hypothetical protein
MNEPVAPRDDTPQARRPREMSREMSETPASGAKGFAIILGAMLGIIGLLWLIAALIAPH